MTENLATLSILGRLIAGREAGGYTLPEELLTAHAAYDQLRTTDPVTFPSPDVDDAARLYVDALAGNGTATLTDLAVELHEKRRQAEASAVALEIHRAAFDVAARRASAAGDKLADEVITDHLAPAFAAMLEQAKGHASVVGTTPLTTTEAMTAAAKVRTAYTALLALDAQREVLVTARGWANAIGHRRLDRDANNEFLSFRTPANVPTYQARRVTWPADPVARMAWLATAAVEGNPWLPTTAQQDEAWLEVYGEGNERRRVAQIAAKAYAGASV